MPTAPPAEPALDPVALLRPRRRVEGISAILLPFTDDAGTVDWPGFRAHVARTLGAGLTPAVNMDTGYVNLLDEATLTRVLDETSGIAAGRPFVAGSFVADRPGAAFDLAAYARCAEAVARRGGTPVIFPSFGLTAQGGDEVVAAHEAVGRACGPFIAFELGPVFAPFGRVYGLDVYEGLMGVKECTGAKHSSLRRLDEWKRLTLRDRIRPDFRVYTGNDLAIDMVAYGSDYLLGLSTFAPDLFARRDALWQAGDPGFYELNDALQYLGAFTFRPPVPAYKHSAAQFLKLRGWVRHDATHPASPRRPDSDVAVLAAMFERLGIESEGGRR